jgi:hypothetical protein
MIKPLHLGTERIISLRLRTTEISANLISANEIKDEFCHQLDLLISMIPKEEHLILIGDFNTRVHTDHDVGDNCLGKFGVGK